MQRSITVDVRPDGTTKIEAHNFKGKGCADATREIELVLAGAGGPVDKKPKPDFYASNTGAQGQRS